MIDFAGWLTIINLIFLVGGGIGGIFAVRSAIAKANVDTQTRVREALHDENELLQARIDRLEKDHKRVEGLFRLLISMLKKTYHIDVDVDGETITLRSQNGTMHSSSLPASNP